MTGQPAGPAARPCGRYTTAGACGATPARPYLQGWRCGAHTPAALAGVPEPGEGRYCAPRRCYCGECAWYVPADVMPTHTPDAFTAFDRTAVNRGQRVSGQRRRAARGTAR